MGILERSKAQAQLTAFPKEFPRNFLSLFVIVPIVLWKIQWQYWVKGTSIPTRFPRIGKPNWHLWQPRARSSDRLKCGLTLHQQPAWLTFIDGLISGLFNCYLIPKLAKVTAKILIFSLTILFSLDWSLVYLVKRVVSFKVCDSTHFLAEKSTLETSWPSEPSSCSGNFKLSLRQDDFWFQFHFSSGIGGKILNSFLCQNFTRLHINRRQTRVRLFQSLHVLI